MSIPCKINPLGIYRRHTDYLPALFLESAGAQWIAIENGYTPQARWGFTFRPTLINNSNYFAGRNHGAYKRVRIQDDTLCLGSYYDVGGLLPEKEIYKVDIDHVNKTATLISADEIYNYDAWWGALTDTYMLVFFGGQGTGQNTADAVGYKAYAQIFDAYIYAAGVKTHDFIPAIDKTGKPCMYDKISNTSFVNANSTKGAADFVVGMTVGQARKLGKLPEDAPTKTLTVSLPASIVDGETVTDAAVKAAMETAKDKGWTITIQTYTE